MFQAYNRRAVYEKNVRQAELRVQQAQSLVREGVITKNEMYRLELANLRLSIQELDNTISVLNNQLIVMLGLPATVMIRPDMALLELPTAPASLPAYLAEANQRNFGLNLARTSLQKRASTSGSCACNWPRPAQPTWMRWRPAPSQKRR